MTALERIEAAATPGSYRVVDSRDATTCIAVEVGALHGLLSILKEQCGFEANTFVTVIDRTPADPRFEVCYQFLSVEHGDRIRVSCRVGGDSPRVPTITDLWPGTSFSEREAFDMFGVEFEGHPDLRRLLMPEAYDHFPLRKEFPHHGIEPSRLYDQWKRERDEIGSPSR